jgi:predicted SAM-dependent methyltransferase
VRRPTSYYKVQKLIGWAIRGRRMFIKRRRADRLQIGCGPNAAPDFVNLDYHWCPGVDACWDITQGLPFPSSVFRAVFTEHCLEHIAFDQCARVLAEIKRVLIPGGVLRIVVPDGQHVIETYTRIKAGEPLAFPADDNEYFTFLSTPMTEVNRAFYCYGHRFIYDYDTLSMLLEKVGFISIRRSVYQEGADPALLIDSARRRGGSLYVEATR